MLGRFSIPTEEQEKIFCTEFVKAFISYERASKAAKLLVMEQRGEQLAPDETTLVKEVCSQWFEQRKRWDFISQTVQQGISKRAQKTFWNESSPLENDSIKE